MRQRLMSVNCIITRGSYLHITNQLAHGYLESPGQVNTTQALQE